MTREELKAAATLFPLHDALPISEERRVGKECIRKVCSR